MTSGTESGSKERQRPSIARKALLSSSALLALIFVLLVVTPVTVSAPIRAGELLILLAAFVAMLCDQPRSRSSRFCSPAELRCPDGGGRSGHPERAQVGGSDESLELAAFTDAFNAMLERLADERRAGPAPRCSPRSESDCASPAPFTTRPARP